MAAVEQEQPRAQAQAGSAVCWTSGGAAPQPASVASSSGSAGTAVASIVGAGGATRGRTGLSQMLMTSESASSFGA